MREGTSYVALTDELTLLADLYERSDMKPIIARDSRHIRMGGSYRLVFGIDADATKTMAFFGKYVEVTPHSRIV